MNEMRKGFPWDIAMGFMVAGMLFGWLVGAALLQSPPAGMVRIGLDESKNVGQAMFKSPDNQIITVLVGDKGLEIGTAADFDAGVRNKLHFYKWWNVQQDGTITAKGT